MSLLGAGKTVLVTGAAGFLGSNLVDRLLARGCHVIGLDNFESGQRKHIERLKHEPRFSFIEHDVVNPIDVKVDAIFHLACPASPPRYQKDPIHTFQTSVWGTHHLLALATRLKARFFFTSTSEVYGDALEHPQNERYWGNVNPIGVRSCYDEGKRGAETLCFDWQRMHQTDIRVVRIFNTYGPRMHPDDGRVVSNFIVQALRGEALTIYGSGQQTRSFCFVDDLLDAFFHVFNAESFSGPVNIGNPNEFTMLELADAVLELTGGQSQKVFKPLPGDDPKQRRPDITLAQQCFGWSPKVQLRQGLAHTIAYFRQELAS